MTAHAPRVCPRTSLPHSREMPAREPSSMRSTARTATRSSTACRRRRSPRRAPSASRDSSVCARSTRRSIRDVRRRQRHGGGRRDGENHRRPFDLKKKNQRKGRDSLRCSPPSAALLGTLRGVRLEHDVRGRSRGRNRKDRTLCALARAGLRRGRDSLGLRRLRRQSLVASVRIWGGPAARRAEWCDGGPTARTLERCSSPCVAARCRAGTVRIPPDGAKLFREVAEREGFEPSVGVKAYARLASGYLRPLGHLSGVGVKAYARLASGNRRTRRRSMTTGRSCREAVCQNVRSRRRRAPSTTRSPLLVTEGRESSCGGLGVTRPARITVIRPAGWIADGWCFIDDEVGDAS
jgi:hypothetical protein